MTKSNIIDLRGGTFSSIGTNADAKAYLATFSNPGFAAKNNTYFGFNNVGLAYGSKINGAKGGSVSDAFFADLRNAALEGGAGTDFVYLAGSRSDWQLDGSAITQAIAGDGSIGITGNKTVKHIKSGATISLSNIEKIRFYDASRFVATHTPVDLRA
jgi:serralysin